MTKWTKEYRKQYKKEWTLKNKERIKEYQSKYSSENREKARQALQRWRLRNPDRVKAHNKKWNKLMHFKKKEWDLKKRFNMTLNDFYKMVEEQNNKCYICFTTFEGELKPCVDHNHNTNKVRKILCRNCNVSLGLLKEDLNILKNMYKYILKHNNEIGEKNG